MNREGRETTPHSAPPAAGRGPVSRLEQPLIFEQAREGQTGVDIAVIPHPRQRLGGLAPRAEVALPGLSEPQAVRHYTRLSQQNYGIDTTFYPLGSCTMKHNARLNERMARLPGFAELHPLQPCGTTQGALKVMDELSHWLRTLTGMPAIALTPGAGAHGEFCGMAAIHAALAARGDARRVVLVPESAHGTNPATAAALGFIVESIPAAADGRVDLCALQRRLGPDVAAIMITNPNTCGLFERDIIAISDAVHQAGGFVYCDGANFNAIAGRVRVADLGVDAMHINLHKTFSTPHGGGGPGSGPVVLSAALAPFAPLPFVHKDPNGSLRLIEDDTEAQALGCKPFGRLKAFHGQMGMFIRALTYCLSHGADGLRQASTDAVLNANYVLARLSGALRAPFPGPCMHEALFDDQTLKDTGLTTLDIAKGLLDAGYHPMTMYFPLVVHGAMLIEPTESESKATLDAFIETLAGLVALARSEQGAELKHAPQRTHRKRLDETRAARQPILRWKSENPAPVRSAAAE